MQRNHHKGARISSLAPCRAAGATEPSLEWSVAPASTSHKMDTQRTFASAPAVVLANTVLAGLV